MVLEKTLASSLDCREIQPVHSKQISPGCSLEGMKLKLKLQYFGHPMRRVNSLEKTLESLLAYKEFQPVTPKGNQSWVFIGRTDVEAETPILWPPDAKS